MIMSSRELVDNDIIHVLHNILQKSVVVHVIFLVNDKSQSLT